MAVRTCELCSYTLCNRVDERCLTQHNMHVTRYKVCGPVDVIPYSHNIALKARCALDFITWTSSAPFDHRGRHTKGGARPTKTERSIGREKTHRQSDTDNDTDIVEKYDILLSEKSKNSLEMLAKIDARNTAASAAQHKSTNCTGSTLSF